MITKNVYTCELCGEKFSDLATCKEHESIPRLGVGFDIKIGDTLEIVKGRGEGEHVRVRYFFHFFYDGKHIRYAVVQSKKGWFRNLFFGEFFKVEDARDEA